MTTNQEGFDKTSDITTSKQDESDSSATASEDPSEETGGEENAVPAKTQQEIEKEEEAKLRSKYPGVKGPGSSAFLQKRLSKGTKYFDSGDYNMAKAKTLPPGSAAALATAAATATADPAFKQPQPPGATGSVISANTVPLRPPGPNPTGSAIPTPECVAHRRLSHLQSKLASNSLS